MGFVFNDGATTLSFTVANGGELLYRLKGLLKTVGWVHQASSDGTNVSNTAGNVNDQITSAAEMNTNNAWWVLKEPGGRQLIVRRGTSDSNWLLAYVPLTSGGAAQTPTASGTTTTIPTFTTTQILHGTLPDTTAAWISGASSKRWAIGADNATPYGFYLCGWATDGQPNSAGGCLIFDPITPGTGGVAADADPYVWHSYSSSQNALRKAGISSDVSGPLAYYRKGVTGEAWGRVAGMFYSITQGGEVPIVPGYAGRSQNGFKELPLPLFYGRRGLTSSNAVQPSGIKGASSLLRWCDGGYPTGAPMHRLAAKDRMVIGDVTVPWDGSTELVWP